MKEEMATGPTHVTYNNYDNSTTINNNITNHNTIQIINFPHQLSDTPVFITSEEQKKQLIDLVSAKQIESPKDIVDAILSFFEDQRKLPFRKESLHLPYTHVHQQGQWELKPDEEVFPAVVLQTSQDMVNLLQHESATLVDSNPTRAAQRLAARLDNQSDRIGEFFDHVDDMERREPSARPTPKEQSHRKAYRTAKQHLKIRAHNAYQTYGIGS